MFYERFVELCTAKGVKPTNACVEAGLSRGLAAKWKSTKTVRPSAEALEKLSVYFGISIDEILGIKKDDGLVSPDFVFYENYIMNAVDRVKAICKSRKIAIYKLEKDLGYANGYIGQLKKGVFPSDRLVEIANYLSVPPSLLTGDEEITMFNPVEYVRSICKGRKIPIATLERDCGFGNGYLNPKKIDKIDYPRAVIIAEYLGLPVEEILTGDKQEEKEKTATNGDDLQALLGASEEDMKAILAFLAADEKQKSAIKAVMETWKY